MATVEFCCKVSPADPSERPVTFIGKRASLAKVSFSTVSRYLASKVTEEVHFEIALSPACIMIHHFCRHGRLLWAA